MKLPVSAIILTLNEEKNIEECIKSINGLTEEIFVVDSYSTDATLEIARHYTGHIYQHPFKNFAQQRNWAQDNLPIKTEWVMHLDADERVSPELAAHLRQAFSSPVKVDGFMMPRRTIFNRQWIKHGGHYPVYHLRVFRRNKGRSEERLYDQNYIVNGVTAEIEGDIINIIDTDLSVWKIKHKKWAQLEAQEVLFNEGRVMNIKKGGNPIEHRNWLRYSVYYKMPLFIRPFLYFFYRFFIKCGFLDGRQGLIFHFFQGFWYRYLVDINIYKLGRKT